MTVAIILGILGIWLLAAIVVGPIVGAVIRTADQEESK